MSIRTRFNPLGTIGRKALLPAGYIELEYLESTGTQYIDTGVVPDDLTGLWELSSKRVQSEDYVSSGARINQTRFYGYCSSRSPEVSYGRGSYVHTGYNISLWDDYVDYKHNYRNSREITANNHVLASNIITISGITSNIIMFGYSTNTTTNVTKCRSRIKYLKLTQDKKLVRNFIPALDPKGRPCMFDTVTQQPFYNKGTGEFNFGYKLPEGYTVVEYLESTGTQYIDTGVDCTSEIGVDFKTQMLSVVNAANAGGIRGGSPIIRHHCTMNQTIFYWYGINDTISRLQVPVSVDDLLPHEITINPVTRVATFDSYSVTIPQFDPFRTETNYYLFSRLNGATGALQSRPSRIYYFKLFDNGRLVRNFIPTLDASNRPCMFDLVKRKTYYNQGTGEFLWGGGARSDAS